jgi:hypothetical protein
MSWGEVPGMALDEARGRIFAFHRADPPVIELDRGGAVLKTWGAKMFVWPHGIRVDRDGSLWMTDGRARDGIGQQMDYCVRRSVLRRARTGGDSPVRAHLGLPRP